jgi:hypothetical protein
MARLVADRGRYRRHPGHHRAALAGLPDLTVGRPPPDRCGWSVRTLTLWRKVI